MADEGDEMGFAVFLKNRVRLVLEEQHIEFNVSRRTTSWSNDGTRIGSQHLHLECGREVPCLILIISKDLKYKQFLWLNDKVSWCVYMLSCAMLQPFRLTGFWTAAQWKRSLGCWPTQKDWTRLSSFLASPNPWRRIATGRCQVLFNHPFFCITYAHLNSGNFALMLVWPHSVLNHTHAIAQLCI